MPPPIPPATAATLLESPLPRPDVDSLGLSAVPVFAGAVFVRKEVCPGGVVTALRDAVLEGTTSGSVRLI